MFDFWSRPKPDPKGRETRRRDRGPVVIGFEQLEGREMLSNGLALTIIPDEIRPLMSMPRPFVGTFDPESPRAIRVSTAPRPRPDGPEPSTPPWPMGGRFRTGRGPL